MLYRCWVRCFSQGRSWARGKIPLLISYGPACHTLLSWFCTLMSHVSTSIHLHRLKLILLPTTFLAVLSFYHSTFQGRGGRCKDRGVIHSGSCDVLYVACENHIFDRKNANIQILCKHCAMCCVQSCDCLAQAQETKSNMGNSWWRLMLYKVKIVRCEHSWAALG